MPPLTHNATSHRGVGVGKSLNRHATDDPRLARISLPESGFR